MEKTKEGQQEKLSEKRIGKSVKGKIWISTTRPLKKLTSQKHHEDLFTAAPFFAHRSCSVLVVVDGSTRMTFWKQS
ncbi:hypothetical protein FVB32_15990 [Flagellimonas hymeniacidonis]|uniref:Uncharacterized protein n=1 Tax=Flagellimonas hymeniacidonis TaxID=2603628 RepID=A0A5C8V4N3_9FLAO|nr:hypothetical protein [Flagellimonas hymeniacidonis]TXN36059.1 hypothetical protein FVB32_15990 [Flagellimonas hymeniacidonis]